MILGSGRYGVEMMANLDRVPPAGATIVVVGAPKPVGGPVVRRASSHSCDGRSIVNGRWSMVEALSRMLRCGL